MVKEVKVSKQLIPTILWGKLFSIYENSDTLVYGYNDPEKMCDASGKNAYILSANLRV